MMHSHYLFWNWTLLEWIRYASIFGAARLIRQEIIFRGWADELPKRRV